jgi:hypothetical protein
MITATMANAIAISAGMVSSDRPRRAPRLARQRRRDRAAASRP